MAKGKYEKYQYKLLMKITRMHSSRPLIDRARGGGCLPLVRGVCLLLVWSGGICFVGGPTLGLLGVVSVFGPGVVSVFGPGVVSVFGPEVGLILVQGRGCLLWGLCFWSPGGMSGPGGRYISQHAMGQTPPWTE